MQLPHSALSAFPVIHQCLKEQLFILKRLIGFRKGLEPIAPAPQFESQL